MDEKVKSRISDIPNAKSKDLAAYVVLYRVFGLEKELALECMRELCRRRDEGEDFDYEDFIANEMEKIPKFDNGGVVSKVISNIKAESSSMIKKVKNEQGSNK